MTDTVIRKPDNEAIPYRGRPAPFMSDDIVHLNVLDKWTQDDNLWVPMSENVWFKPLCLSPTAGYFTNILRVRKSGVLSRHRHSGPVHAMVLKGRWYYLEHDWVAE